MIETIKQRYEKDCFLACAAMAVGKSYDDCAALWGNDLVQRIAVEGTYKALSDEVLRLLGLERERDYRVVFPAGNEMAAVFHRAAIWGRRAMMQVHSLNNPGEYHMIYWDGADFHDPSNRKTYTAWKDVIPLNLWIFNERRA